MIEFINKPGLLYRVGKADDQADGLWYDADGKETGLIHTLKNAAAASLPMGPHPLFRVDGCKWISATDTRAMLRQWFSYGDILELLDRGYEVFEIEVRNYRRFFFPGYAHEVFCKEQVIDRRVIDPEEVYPGLYARMAAE